MAFNGNFGYEHLLKHTPDQIRWLYDEGERVRAAQRVGFIDDLHSVITRSFSEDSSQAARAATEYVDALRKLGGYSYTGKPHHIPL